VFASLHDQTVFNVHQKLRVPVTLGVMSACPDAILCESVIDQVLQDVQDKVDLSLTYIGKLNASEPNYGVTCMHGTHECAGNIQQLCLAKYAPSTSQWWDFVQCQNAHGRFVVGLPEVAFECADKVGVDWDLTKGLPECAGTDALGGREGIHLLRESVEATKEIGITKSCSILINGNLKCVVDGGEWKECPDGHAPQDFVRQIEEEYQKLNAEAL